MPLIAGRNRTGSLSAAPPGRGGGSPLPQLVPIVQADWSTATGTGGLSNGGIFNQIGGAGSTVIANPGTLGFPALMANVAQIIALEVEEGYSEARKTSGITNPAIGETLDYRDYFYVDSETDNIPAFGAGGDDETHGTQDGSADSQINWGWWCYHNTGGAGKWTPQWRPNSTANPYPANRWELDAPLNKDTCYRREWGIIRTGTTTFKPYLSIFDESISLTVPIKTDANFLRLDDDTPLATYILTNDFTFSDITRMAAINTLLNGIAGTGWFPFSPLTYGYQGGLAICLNQGPIGPYGSVEGEPQS